VCVWLGEAQERAGRGAPRRTAFGRPLKCGHVNYSLAPAALKNARVTGQASSRSAFYTFKQS